MSPRATGDARRVVVVTGGAIGIGAAIAEEFGRVGYHVVTMDPVVALDGSPMDASSEPTTADRIVAAGGSARASNTSVTDDGAVRALFTGLVDEFGALDVVVNVAGISRPTGFASGTEEDWAKVIDVHLNGYLTVLRNALPIMASAGYGQILGVTSGSGWRAADAGAYSCAKRAVASLTWQIGRAAPAGVSVNALSPIAATRMVANALARQAGSGGGDRSGRSAASGGVALGAAPPAEHLGPVGAYLAGDEFAWCTGQVIFSGGSEVSVVAPPHLLEVMRTDAVTSVAHALDTVVPVAFLPAEAAQTSNGGSVPRFTGAFDQAAGGAAGSGRCVVVSDDATRGAVLAEVLAGRGLTCVEVDGAGAASGFAGAAERFAAAAAGGPVDAVVVALGGGAGPDGASRWARILAEHAGIGDQILADASWVRAAADHSAGADRPIRVVTVTDATSAGGRSRAMAAAQLARVSRASTADRVTAFSVGVETDAASGWRAAAEMAAYLAVVPDAAGLAGAELVADADWIGLRGHPRLVGTVSYGGPAIPGWLDGALRRLVHGDFDPDEQ